MKKLYGIVALAALLAGCNEADMADGAMNNGITTKSVNIEMTTSAPTSRVAVDNSTESWALSWCAGDALHSILLDSEGGESLSDSHFTVAAEDISSDGTQAAISGEVAASAAEMIMVYPASSLSMQNDKFTINIPDSEVDMSAPYANLGAATVLVSDKVALEDGVEGYKTQMHHLTTVLELGMKFDNLDPNYTYQIRRVAIGDLATKLCLNPEFSYGDVGFDNIEYNESSEELDVVVKNCFVEGDESIVIPITSFRFWLEPEAVLPVTIYIEAKSKSGDYESFCIVKSEDIENTSGEVLYFNAGTYNSVKHTYDLEAEISRYAGSWLSKGALSFDDGDGSVLSPYQIATAEQLARLALLSYTDFSAMEKSYILTDDIDLSAYPWLGVVGFKGTFDGKNHTISGLNGTEAIFFSIEDATVCHLNVDGEISHTEGTGSVVGVSANSRIHDCSSSVDQSSGYVAGGIVGATNGSNVITNCFNTGRVAGYMVAGGIVGSTNGSLTISNCYNLGDITGSYVGGIVSVLDVDSRNVDLYGVYNVGKLSGRPVLVGGIYSENQSSDCAVNLKGCYSLSTGDDAKNGDPMPATMEKLKSNLCSASALYNRTVDTAAGDVKAWSWELPGDGGYPVINYGSIWISISAGFE